MYKPIDKLQHSFLDFNQPMGLKMNPQNRWIKMADLIPWDEFEAKYAEQFMSDGYALEKSEISLYLTICKLYEQQKYMYDNKTHSVEHRIVSLSQSWSRPIVRGKTKAPVEFGAKLDLSIDNDGYSRIEKISSETYNESTCLIEAVERFRERNGCYPEGYWQIRYTEQEKTVSSVKNTEYDYPVQSLVDQVQLQKLIKNKSIRIIRIKLKWKGGCRNNDFINRYCDSPCVFYDKP